MKKIVMGILVLASIGFIFLNSSQDGQQSNSRSKSIVYTIIEKFSNNSEDAFSSNGDCKYKASKLNFIIRKIAHGLEFLLLATVFSVFLSTLGLNLREIITYSLFTVLFLAVMDEFYQLYIPSRYSSVKDVLIDFTGGFVGTILTCICINIFKEIRRKKERQRMRIRRERRMRRSLKEEKYKPEEI